MDQTRVRLAILVVAAAASASALITFHVLENGRPIPGGAEVALERRPSAAAPALPSVPAGAEHEPGPESAAQDVEIAEGPGRQESAEAALGPSAELRDVEVAPKPSFDVVRVEPGGEAVVAGRAAPNQRVDLLANGQIVGSGTASRSGEWVIIPEARLGEADQLLTLRSTTPDGKALLSEQSVTVGNVGPEKTPLVLLASPEKPSTVLQKPSHGASPEALAAQHSAGNAAEAHDGTPQASSFARSRPAGAAERLPSASDRLASIAAAESQPGVSAPPSSIETAKPSVSSGSGGKRDALRAETPSSRDLDTKIETVAVPEPSPESAPAAAAPSALTIETVEYEEAGRLFVTGKAGAGARLRVYLNDTHLRDVLAGTNSEYELALNAILPTGRYRVRIDSLEPKSARVLARVEVSFERDQVEGATFSAELSSRVVGAAVAGGAAAGATVSAESAEPTVVLIKRGDNLWRIARQMYGRGIRFTNIYNANTDQIRDPHWIYPGQVFVVPLAPTDG